MSERYQVTGYCGWPAQLWCVVDSTKFLGEAEKLDNWPMRVDSIPPFRDRNEAQRVADKMNQQEPTHGR